MKLRHWIPAGYTRSIFDLRLALCREVLSESFSFGRRLPTFVTRLPVGIQRSRVWARLYFAWVHFLSRPIQFVVSPDQQLGG
jgi:hypothetical protein